jgi:hypothetical protein
MWRRDLEELELATIGDVEDADDRETGSRRCQPEQRQGSRLEGAEEQIDRLLQDLFGRPNMDYMATHPLNTTNQQLAIAIARVHDRAMNVSEIDGRGCRLQSRSSLTPKCPKRSCCRTEILSMQVCWALDAPCQAQHTAASTVSLQQLRFEGDCPSFGDCNRLQSPMIAYRTYFSTAAQVINFRLQANYPNTAHNSPLMIQPGFHAITQSVQSASRSSRSSSARISAPARKRFAR